MPFDTQYSVTATKFRDVTKSVAKKRTRGRPLIGRKAMTAAQRQARYRQRIRDAQGAARKCAEELAGKHRPQQPPYGHAKAMGQLQAASHHFERARREFGFEEGVFVDGAFLGSHEVIELAKMSLSDRKQYIGEKRHEDKHHACGAVEGYMAALHVSPDELIRYREVRREQQRRHTECALAKASAEADTCV
jgi:hypothetical protein